MSPRLLRKLADEAESRKLQAPVLTRAKAHFQPPASKSNDLSTSFSTFLRHLHTIDEGRAGEVRPWPFDDNTDPDPKGRSWDAYWRDWETTLLGCPLLMIDKTRRTMATNTVAAFDLWLLLGGQDVRWPALMRSTGYRRVLIQGRKQEGPGGSAEFVGRVRQLYEVSVARGLTEAWPGLPTADWTFGRGLLSNGSRVDAVPQGADQVRGPGTTLIHAEELSFWEQAQSSVEAAIPALQPDGHYIAVTTPQAATYASRLRRGEVR